MSKKKRKKKPQRTPEQKVVSATVLIQLVTALIELINKLTE